MARCFPVTVSKVFIVQAMRLSVVVDLLRVVPVATCHVARLTIASVRPLWRKLRYWIKEAENAAIATTTPNTLSNGGMWRMTLRWPSMPLLLYPSRFPRRATKSVAGHCTGPVPPRSYQSPHSNDLYRPSQPCRIDRTRAI
jgi:hypothetical protein